MYLLKIFLIFFSFLYLTSWKIYSFEFISNYGIFAGYKHFSKKSRLDPNIVSGFTLMSLYKENYLISGSLGMTHTYQSSSEASENVVPLNSRKTVFVPHFNLYVEKQASQSPSLQDLWIGAGIAYDTNNILFPSFVIKYYLYLSQYYFSSINVHFGQEQSIQITFLK